MNITTINELVSINIVLDRDEAIAALDDPSELLAQLREALGDIGPVMLGRRNGRKIPKGKALTRGRARKMIPCPQCDMAFARPGNLTRHLTKVHGGSSGAPVVAA